MRVRVLGNFPNIDNFLYLTDRFLVDSIGKAKFLLSAYTAEVLYQSVTLGFDYARKSLLEGLLRQVPWGNLPPEE
jgi:hypothetical protein